MATQLLKPVRRELTRAMDRKGRSIIVTITPEETLQFKSKGLRRSYTVSLGECMNLAIATTLQKEYDIAMAEYHRLKKAGRLYLRKPRRPFLPFTVVTKTARR